MTDENGTETAEETVQPVFSPAADIARAYREGYMRARHDAHQEHHPKPHHSGLPVALVSATSDPKLLKRWREQAMRHYPDPTENA